MFKIKQAMGFYEIVNAAGVVVALADDMSVATHIVRRMNREARAKLAHSSHCAQFNRMGVSL